MRAEALTTAEKRAIAALFAEGYQDADLGYLDESLERLRWVALATDDEAVVGFSLSDSRRIDLPRLPGQVVRLAGLACVATAFRRRGVMTGLSRLGVMESFPEDPGLVAGRMANPATFRGMMRLSTAVPKIGIAPSAWHREIGAAIADAYGVRRFDPDTFVCIGRGRPIGFPVLDVEATAEELGLFRRLDRQRGDSLLGFAWLGTPPPGW